ncbi:NAD(P)H-hydrate epimerase [bacterium]|nr:NAD(P)H-hydrate epimerase [bacterium]
MTKNRSLSRDEVREFDARAIEIGIPGIVLMENAARGATDLLLSLGVDGPISIVCGKGNNAGDGFVMARQLTAAGYSATVELLGDPDLLKGDARLAFKPLGALKIPVRCWKTDAEGKLTPAQLAELRSRFETADWLVDAMLGTGTQGAIRSPFDQVIELMNYSGRKILAVDLPSGLDADTGKPLGPTIHATATATFVARKKGFDVPGADGFTGTVQVVSLGLPADF